MDVGSKDVDQNGEDDGFRTMYYIKASLCAPVAVTRPVIPFPDTRAPRLDLRRRMQHLGPGTVS